MDFRNQRIGVSELKLDLQNPRHPIFQDKTQAIEWMVTNQRDKIKKLATDIATHGLNPIESLLVIEDGNGYTVVEGNRRLTALMFLHTPDLCPDTSLQSYIRGIAVKHPNMIPADVSCIIAPSRRAADRWIRLRHGGEQEGIGTVRWSTKEQATYNERNGHKDPNARAHALLKCAVEKGLVSQEVANNVAITNLRRLVSDPAVRTRMGVDFNKDNGPVYKLDPQESDKAITRVLKDLASKQFTVNNIRTQENREKYITQVITEEGVDQHRPLPEPAPMAPEKTPATGGDKAPRPTDNKPSTNRKFLIDTGWRMKINHSRLNDIYLELKKINVDDFPNAVAVLFRTFIEGCVNEYLPTVNNQYKNPNYLKEHSLSDRVNNALNALEEAGKLTSQQRQAVNKVMTLPDRIGSINTFNTYVHNHNFHPLPTELKITWNSIASMFKAMEGTI